MGPSKFYGSPNILSFDFVWNDFMFQTLQVEVWYGGVSASRNGSHVSI